MTLESAITFDIEQEVARSTGRPMRRLGNEMTLRELGLTPGNGIDLRFHVETIHQAKLSNPKGYLDLSVNIGAVKEDLTRAVMSRPSQRGRGQSAPA